MTKAKKVLSFCLAVVMVIGMFAFGAFAAGENATISVTVDQASVKTGDIVNVTVKLTTDYFVGPLQLPIHYDPAVLQYVDSSANPADVFGANGATKTVVSQTNNGCVQFGFVPVTDKGAVSQKLTDYQIVTFQLNAIKDGSSEVALHADDQKSAGNANGQLYVGSFTSSNTDEVANPVGQTLKLTGTTVKVGGGSTEKNTLVVKDTFANASSVVIDKYAPEFFLGDTETTGVVYGIETLGYSNGFETTYMLADALTTTAGDSYLRVTSENAEGYETTGALIEVLDTDNQTVLETYYFVYFGDVNGDGYVDNSDCTAVMTYAMDETSLSTIYEILAGDVNGDTYADNADATTIATAALNDSGYSVQEELATLFWETISPEYGI